MTQCTKKGCTNESSNRSGLCGPCEVEEWLHPDMTFDKIEKRSDQPTKKELKEIETMGQATKCKYPGCKKYGPAEGYCYKHWRMLNGKKYVPGNIKKDNPAISKKPPIPYYPPEVIQGLAPADHSDYHTISIQLNKLFDKKIIEAKSIHNTLKVLKELDPSVQVPEFIVEI